MIYSIARYYIFNYIFQKKYNNKMIIIDKKNNYIIQEYEESIVNGMVHTIDIKFIEVILKNMSDV